MWEKIVFVLFGWLLGLGGTVIIDEVRRRRENREVRAALRIELMELQYRLATAAYMIQMRLGTLSRSTLEWLRPIVANYEGMNRSEKLLQGIDRTLAVSDPEIAAAAQSTKAPPDGALALKKYAAPLLQSKFALLSSFDAQLQNQLLEIQVHLGLFNEEVDQARYYFRLTFGGASEKNYDRVLQNLSGCHKNASERAKIIADQIGKIIW